jgi:hypothetical protein
MTEEEENRGKLNAQWIAQNMSPATEEAVRDLMNKTPDYPFPPQGEHLRRILNEREEKRGREGRDI